ncbi:nitrous oxide reductase family maturation protein NosD [Chryseobacterium lacus]|uniref:Nitrous oxide reductase family maturation protein NosD n=1 Tax=Chryseobacterium lacus TaxID=2058346 RepID=A0A368MYI9_9FLAO|nr:nitrous oxide reductase family maturation protein NosD [Chryseobacterium lacus]RCU43086.1 nitrous oxide reductase family maturation protein NosD [Chryseobacterium lacus]RST27934.1 nitrous oxide reductase family maturation protein NosD [Chryseobacterium lacus]
MYKLLLLFLPILAFSNTLKVGKNEQYRTIKQAVAAAKSGDSILVEKGIYREGPIHLEKSLTLIGIGRPVIDGELKSEIITFKADRITLKGFKLINSGRDEIKSISAVHIYTSSNSVIEDNIFENNYFGIYVQRGYRCLIQNNKITTNRGTSQENIGDGIHLLGSSEIWVKNNYISGHKDGIYLEKNKRCFIFKNLSRNNLRYGLHFMFSDDSVYTGNVFDKNGAGVAVMYAMNVSMYNNRFINNWGDSVFGLLLKEISYSRIKGNTFENNTTAIFADGATKIDFYNNHFEDNGWALKLNSNCMENRLFSNNFINNTFDVSTNGSTVMNDFKQNYWDKYAGYDLDKDKIGDVPFHPLSLYSVLVERNPAVMLLFRTFFVDLLDKSEKILPSLTPESFVDREPLMKPVER